MAKRGDRRRKGAFYFDLAAMVLAFATVEAYCNFLMHLLDPTMFRRERRYPVLERVTWACKAVKASPNRRRRPSTTALVH
jgi:hypothetical protein